MTRYLRSPRRQLTRLGLVSLCALALTGCASQQQQQRPAGQSDEAKRLIALLVQQSQREKALNSTWQGQPYDSLLKAFGEPPMTMGILGERPLKTSLVVYTLIDTDTQCVDAFTMVKDDASGQWRVADYFCR